MSNTFDTLLGELVTASRVLANEGVVDGFGHVSARHPERADRFFLSRVRAPALVTRDDLLEFEFDGSPVIPTDKRVFAERVIHAAVYRLRSDVMAVCHHHAPSMLPFCVSGVALVPVFHHARNLCFASFYG